MTTFDLTFDEDRWVASASIVAGAACLSVLLLDTLLRHCCCRLRRGYRQVGAGEITTSFSKLVSKWRACELRWALFGFAMCSGKGLPASVRRRWSRNMAAQGLRMQPVAGKRAIGTRRIHPGTLSADTLSTMSLSTVLEYDSRLGAYLDRDAAGEVGRPLEGGGRRPSMVSGRTAWTQTRCVHASS
jgi:hypothetical protein